MSEEERWPESTEEALERVCKWRTVLMGRIVGSMSKDDPHYQGWRDLIDKLILLRVEGSAMAGLLIEKGIITETEWAAKLRSEAEELDKLYQQTFPGVWTFSGGLDIYDVQAFNERVQQEGWPR